jgi:hypothetical protein
MGEIKRTYAQLYVKNWAKNWEKLFQGTKDTFTALLGGSITASVALGEALTEVSEDVAHALGHIFSGVGTAIQLALADDDADRAGTLASAALEQGFHVLGLTFTSIVEKFEARVAEAAAREAVELAAKQAAAAAKDVVARELTEATAARIAAGEVAAATGSAVARDAAVAAALRETEKRVALEAAEGLLASAVERFVAQQAAAQIAKTALVRVALFAAGATTGLPGILTAALGFVATTVVEISVKSARQAYDDSLAQEAPNVWDLQQNSGINEGVFVTSLTPYLFDLTKRNDGLRVSIHGLQSGIDRNNIDLLNTDKLILTTFADRLEVRRVDLSNYEGWRFFGGDHLTVDMAGFTPNRTVTNADFDTTSYMPRSGTPESQSGVFWYDGYTHEAGSFGNALATVLGSIGGSSGVSAALWAESFFPAATLRVIGTENITLTDKDDRFAFTGKDYGVHSGFGTISAGAGNDIVQYEGGEFAASGTAIDAANHVAAGQNLQLTLDGGTGNDWVIADSGAKVITAGGLGRDWVYNTSAGGLLYGDTTSGYYDAWVLNDDGTPKRDAAGNPVTEPVRVADSAENGDNFWWAPGVTIMDAQHHDVLKFYGLTLTGGNSDGGLVLQGRGTALVGSASVDQSKRTPEQMIYGDHFFSFIQYYFTGNDRHGVDLHVTNKFNEYYLGLGGATGVTNQRAGELIVRNFDLVGSYSGYNQFGLAGAGTLNMVFRITVPTGNANALTSLDISSYAASLATRGLSFIDSVETIAAAAIRFAKGSLWSLGVDPLVLDLSGDGIETTALDGSGVYFDGNNDLFDERTGWLSGNDGFLALDKNGNGTIDDVTELFGSFQNSGFADLAQYDSNHDGKIDAGDAIWNRLLIWQDYSQDGISQAGELKTLDAIGIASIGLASTPLDVTTPQGTLLRSSGRFTRTDGTTGSSFEAIFATDAVDTHYAGESGRASWSASLFDLKGFGRVTNLSAATANDFDLAALVTARAAAMTVPDLQTLVAQAGDVLGAWGETLETSRELYAVRLSADGKTLLEHTLWDGGLLASGWSLEQGWSPSTRGVARTDREAAPYLMRVVDGRAVVLDYAVRAGDGRWRLASAPATSYATRADVTALAHAAGTEWRTESLQFNPYANLPVEAIGVRFIDGQAVDYTVKVTDRDGSFYVWARNLARALQLQWKTGDAREFNLRNYEVDFAHLDEVGSTDDSQDRVELLTPAQFHFATNDNGEWRRAA